MTETGVALQAGGTEIDTGNIFAPETKPLPSTPREPVYERARIEGWAVNTVPTTGSISLREYFSSLDRPAKFHWDIWVPTEYAVNPAVDPNTLSTTPPPGKKQSAKQRYGNAVSNSARNKNGEPVFNQMGSIQKSLFIAQEAGRLNERPPVTHDIKTVAELLSALTTGLEVIVLRRPQNNDPQFLEVANILRPQEINNPKAFRVGVRKLWEQMG